MASTELIELNHNIHVGCSGWQYAHWRGDVYPAELATSRWFAHYALSFDTVEINNTFYRLPEAKTFDAWREQAPTHFRYAVKASRFLPLELFFERARHLGSHLGPILYQLPPRWPIDLERFETFLRALPRGHQHVVEFRDPSWYDDRVFELLDHHGVVLCLHDMEGAVTGTRLVGPFVYVRFHVGTTKYGGRYPDDTLDDWAAWLAARASDGLHVFAYFNNDTGGHAPRDAARLRRRLLDRLNPPATIATDADTGAFGSHAGDRRVPAAVRTTRR